MATVEDAAALALGLPEVTQGSSYGHRSWTVGKATFAWERPLRKADLKRFGARVPPAAPPTGPIIAIRTEDLGDKQAILAGGPAAFFTIEHFTNFPAYLIQLDEIGLAQLREAMVDGWLACAPPDLGRAFLAG